MKVKRSEKKAREIHLKHLAKKGKKTRDQLWAGSTKDILKALDWGFL